MLRPLYTNRATQVLLVGPPASGKRTLANQLLRSPKIFYSTKILEEMDRDTLDRLVDIDYVLIFVDMTNTTSMPLLEETLAYMEPGYLLCKCAVVFTKVDMVDRWMLDEVGVRDIIEQYGDPYTFYVNLQDAVMRINIADQITRAIGVGTSQRRDVHPLGMRFLTNHIPMNDININNSNISHMQSEHDQSERYQYENDQYEDDTLDREQSYYGQSDQGKSDQEQSDQEQSDQAQSDQGQSDQAQSDQGQSDQEQSEQGRSDQKQSDQEQSDQEDSDQGQD